MAKKPESKIDYVTWKARVRSLTKGPMYLHERDLRNLFIEGKTPEQATGVDDTVRRNARIMGTRKRR